MNELGYLPDGAAVTATDFNGLVAIVNALTRLIDNIDTRLDLVDARVDVVIEYLELDIGPDVVDLPDLSTYQPEETQ